MPLATDFAFITEAPTGTELVEHRMSSGERMGAAHPEDAKIFMDPDYPGLDLPDLVGNTRGLFIVSERLKNVLAATLTVPCEYLQVHLYNHKRRLASSAYFIVNVLGTVDCLDPQRSQIEYMDSLVVGVDKFVLDPEKLKGAPELFRIREEPRRLVIRRSLIDRLMPPTPTNFFVRPMEI